VDAKEGEKEEKKKTREKGNIEKYLNGLRLAGRNGGEGYGGKEGSRG
jgi:hypothetical protein